MKGLFIKKGDILFRLTKKDEEKDTKEYKMEELENLIIMGLDTESNEELYVVGTTQEEFQSVINNYFNKVENDAEKSVDK